MSHFAKVINGIVTAVISAEQDFIDSFPDDTGGKWVQTSYNTRHNIHYGPDGNPDGGVALRGNFAGIGYIYDEENDVFYPPKQHNSWILDKQRWEWVAPIPYPNDGKGYFWDEENQSWV